MMKSPILRTTQVNVYDCVHPLMNDPKEMSIFLSKLVEFIGMTVIPEELIGQKNPHSFPYKPESKPVEDHGISGSVILVESHACSHSWISKNFLNVVITSCKHYDEKSLLSWILVYTSSNIYKYNTINF
jgi:S-adenosylmethionine/arginine decarboxylase-like enzyme